MSPVLGSVDNFASKTDGAIVDDPKKDIKIVQETYKVLTEIKTGKMPL